MAARTGGMAAAGVAAAVAFAAVVFAVNVGVIAERSRKQGRNSFIGAAGYAAVEQNAGFLQRGARTAADAAADEHVDMQAAEKGRERLMTAVERFDFHGGDDAPVLCFVELETIGLTEMLKNVSVIVSDCNSHGKSPFAVSKKRDK